MVKHLIVIGAVAAGTKTAAKARREDESLKITVYTQEQYISYAGCGLPYFIGDDIKEQSELVVKTPEDFKAQFNIDILIEHLVRKIDPEKKEVTVLNLKENKEFVDKYDTLMIATGASPFVPPIEGKDLKNVFNLRSVKDAIEIKDLVNTGSIKNAVIVGGGLIGMEVAEALHHRGVKVAVVELLDQILGPIDKEMADIIEDHCKEKGVKILTSDGVTKLIGDSEGKVQKVVTNKEELDADLVLMSIGVRPNVDIAKEAGVEIGPARAIKVNSKMQTNVKDIYAAGDCVESTHIVTHQPVWIPLGSVANKQGRVAALNITGGNAEFAGVLGSLIVKVFDLTAAKTGLAEKEAQKLGYDYETVTVTGKDKPGYYPGNKEIIIKMVANRKTGQLLGAQVVGEGEADKRIDVVAMALTAQMSLDDFVNLDLAYAPPFSPAIDLVQVATSQLQAKLAKVTV